MAKTKRERLTTDMLGAFFVKALHNMGYTVGSQVPGQAELRYAADQVYYRIIIAPNEAKGLDG